jgi:hypothetical protein
MPTLGSNAQQTEFLRKPLWGAAVVTPSSDQPYVHSSSQGQGYLSSSNFIEYASSDEILKTWDPESGNVYDRPVSPILRSGCMNAPCCTTNNNTNKPPFREGGNDANSDFACILIDKALFSTGTGSEWDNKIRIVIFSGCQSTGENTSWELELNCLACNNCNSDLSICGGVASSSSSSENFNFGVFVLDDQNKIGKIDLITGNLSGRILRIKNDEGNTLDDLAFYI